ncbi:MAG: tRNA pseudouridine(55) synthase TruB [Chloroflexi bacterium]|nr:tRNA pseudouridine(55) synthase TruB [Chloroflexota bacterium]
MSGCASCARGCSVSTLRRLGKTPGAGGVAALSQSFPPVETLNGLLNVDKPQGMTSHDVVHAIRRAGGLKRVGHAGTLDPDATGVLIVGIGTGTKVMEFLADNKKVYRAEICLGVTTDTDDSTGEVISVAAGSETPAGFYHTPAIPQDLAGIKRVLQRFQGTIRQIPPMYAAIKVKGVPLYKLARQGKEIEREPRQVHIERLEILDFHPPLLTVEVACSKGTYIRSLARDIGESLGCGAYLKQLIRLANGRFELSQAESLEVVLDSFRQGYIEQILHPVDEALLHFDVIVVDAETGERIRNGQFITAPNPIRTTTCRAYTSVGDFLALLEFDGQREAWHPRKVFA